MDVTELKLLSNEIRIDIINMLHIAGSGHSGGALGLADIFTTLYFDILKHDFENPNWEERDFVFLSNGHVCPVLYATLAQANYFEKKELATLRKLGSRLQGHPHFRDSQDKSDLKQDSQYDTLPGVENSGGPLGQGISQAVGLAVSLKRDKKKNRVYCFVGDGELEEGQCWEAILYAGKEKLDNLTIILDRNHMQIDGDTKDVLPLEPLNKKFLAFNFATVEFDGNDIKQIKHAFSESSKIKDKPICLIANTVPGKGVSFMENNISWHGKAPNKEEFEQAIVDLTVRRVKIKNGEL